MATNTSPYLNAGYKGKKIKRPTKTEKRAKRKLKELRDIRQKLEKTEKKRREVYGNKPKAIVLRFDKNGKFVGTKSIF